MQSQDNESHAENEKHHTQPVNARKTSDVSRSSRRTVSLDCTPLEEVFADENEDGDVRENGETDGKDEAVTPACFGEVTSDDRTDSITGGGESALSAVHIGIFFYR